jgi:hypothetical protein
LAPAAAWTALALIVLFAHGCATPVGLDEQAAHRELDANVLSTGQPSSYSTQIWNDPPLAKASKAIRKQFLPS